MFTLRHAIGRSRHSIVKTYKGSACTSNYKPTIAMAQSLRMFMSTPSILDAQKSPIAEMTYRGGMYTLAVPLPVDEDNEERVFSLSPEMSVGDITSLIKKEEKNIQNVALRPIGKSKSCEEDEILNDIVSEDLELLINDHVIPVASPVFTGNSNLSLSVDGELDVRSVTQKAAVISLRRALVRLNAWKISKSEFVQLCAENGIQAAQVPELLDAFHRSGIVFYFDREETSSSKHDIYLHPQSVVDSYLSAVGLTPVTSGLFQNHKTALNTLISKINPEYEAMSKLLAELERLATRRANLTSYGLSASLVGGFGTYFWLTFIHFSWDIMEPVTYFTGFGVTIIGYTWWSLTNQEYEYENIYDYIFQKRLAKLKVKTNFPEERYAQLSGILNAAQEDVAALDEVLRKPPALQAQYLYLLDKPPPAPLPSPSLSDLNKPNEDK